jgi:hypothetical protein
LKGKRNIDMYHGADDVAKYYSFKAHVIRMCGSHVRDEE